MNFLNNPCDVQGLSIYSLQKTGEHCMKFLEKLRAEAHKAFHEEKKKINAEIAMRKEFEAMVARCDEVVSMRLRQIGNTFFKNLFFLKKYKILSNREELSWTLRGHVFKSDIHPIVNIKIREECYHFSVEYWHGNDKFRKYECFGKTDDLSGESIEDMFVKIAISIAQAMAAKNISL
ncbi:MAG: hypothetical protein CDV28_12820 [Candidatus Electronema aureum]|uniref:Uncharacterized protein n=1 Tax=Candidatus Electronema aureum TaxID=2005002 RepID=A0A521G038_9BACT|nr:MAG: hypothetical protein CDV28_12820 [Candidatus Electronema aureum]